LLFNPIIVASYNESLLYSHKNNFLIPFPNEITKLRTIKNSKHSVWIALLNNLTDLELVHSRLKFKVGKNKFSISD